MISHGPDFIARHTSGRYLDITLHIETERSGCHVPGVPMVWTYALVGNPFDAKRVDGPDHWPRWIAQDASRAWIADQFEVVPGPGCGCCGERSSHMISAGDVHRCDDHMERNPCAIEGCKRTTSARGTKSGRIYLANDQWLCSDHWRRFVPPRSKLRQHYHLIFRRAKREGWTPELERRFWRYWTWLVAQARRKATGGDLNIAEIERMFGP